MQRRDQKVELVERGRGLAFGRTHLDKAANVLLDVFHRGPVLAAGRDVREGLRELGEGARRAASVPAEDHDRGLALAGLRHESVFDHLDQTLAGGQRGDLELLVSDQTLHHGMFRAHQDEHGQSLGTFLVGVGLGGGRGGSTFRSTGRSGGVDGIGGDHQRQRDSRRFETDAGGQIDDALGPFTECADHDLGAIRNQISVRITKAAVD